MTSKEHEEGAIKYWEEKYGKTWTCPDCGKKYPHSLISKHDDIRKKFVPCKGTGRHRHAASRFYRLG